MATSPFYEVVKIDGEYCLRIKESGRPVAWSKKDDAAWKSYVAEAQANALTQMESE